MPSPESKFPPQIFSTPVDTTGGDTSGRTQAENALHQQTGEDEIERKARAQALGLDENASWTKIHNAQDRKERIEVAKALNLSDEHDKYPESHSWREILVTGVLGMVDRPILDTTEVLNRIQQARASVKETPELRRMQQTRREYFGDK
jgi:hypothetical protein